MRNLVLLIALITPLGQQSVAASFDCKKATSSTEKLICSSTVLEEMDSEMASLYREITHASMPLEAKKLRANQKNWLKERNQCSNMDCLKKSLQDRISSLKKEQEMFHVYSRNEDGKRVNATILDQFPFLNQYIQKVDSVDSKEVTISIHEQNERFLVLYVDDFISADGAYPLFYEEYAVFSKATGRQEDGEKIFASLSKFKVAKRSAIRDAYLRAYNDGGGCDETIEGEEIELIDYLPSRKGLGLFKKTVGHVDSACSGPFYLDWKTAQPFLSESGVKVMRSFTQ